MPISRADILAAINAKLLEVNRANHGDDRTKWRFLHQNEIVDAIESLLAVSQIDCKVPPGWKLVPEDPTEQMIDASVSEVCKHGVFEGDRIERHREKHRVR